MSSVLFLLGAFALSALGTAAIMWRNRKPTRIDAGIREFEREMRALSPEARRSDTGANVRPRDRPDGSQRARG